MFLQSSHLALIDTLMMAYTVEMVSVERVMTCINRCSSAEPSHMDGHLQELPYDTEDAIHTWINKVHTHTRMSTQNQKDVRILISEDNELTRPRADVTHASFHFPDAADARGSAECGGAVEFKPARVCSRGACSTTHARAREMTNR